jgi:GTP cyclohydrolase I
MTTTNEIATALTTAARHFVPNLQTKERILTLVGIPRGGVPASYLLAGVLSNHFHKESQVLSTYELEDVLAAEGLKRQRDIILVDDILTTGETMFDCYNQMTQKPLFMVVPYLKGSPSLLQRGEFASLVFGQRVAVGEWVEFPWETNDADGGRPEDAVRRLIEYAGADPNEVDLKDTPRRVLAFYDELKRGADADVPVTLFADQRIGDLTLVRAIPFYSLCQHHMLPFFGEMSVGYVPKKEIIGVSKIVRYVKRASSQLQTQEFLSHDVATQLQTAASSEDVAVVARATHTCMTMRGPLAHGSEMVSSAMLGKFRSNEALRQEFLSLAKP